MLPPLFPLAVCRHRRPQAGPPIQLPSHTVRTVYTAYPFRVPPVRTVYTAFPPACPCCPHSLSTVQMICPHISTHSLPPRVHRVFLGHASLPPATHLCTQSVCHHVSLGPRPATNSYCPHPFHQYVPVYPPPSTAMYAFIQHQVSMDAPTSIHEYTTSEHMDAPPCTNGSTTLIDTCTPQAP